MGRGAADYSQTSLTLRNLAMINDRLAKRSFKQQTFPREKILCIRNERLGKSLSVSTLQDYVLPSSSFYSVPRSSDTSPTRAAGTSFFILNVSSDPLSFSFVSRFTNCYRLGYVCYDQFRMEQHRTFKILLTKKNWEPTKLGR